jgi:hypothetical protein
MGAGEQGVVAPDGGALTKATGGLRLLSGGVRLTLAAAIAGWWVGSRSRLADAETEDVGVRVRR